MPRLPKHAELLAKLTPLHAQLAQDKEAANRPIYQTTPEQVGGKGGGDRWTANTFIIIFPASDHCLSTTP